LIGNPVVFEKNEKKREIADTIINIIKKAVEP
jgi:hypothetical protein